jgi:hypothetical protein
MGYRAFRGTPHGYRHRTVQKTEKPVLAATSPGPFTPFTKLRWVEKVAVRGESKATVVSNDGLRFDLRVVPAGLYGNLLQHFTQDRKSLQLWIAWSDAASRVSFLVTTRPTRTR